MAQQTIVNTDPGADSPYSGAEKINDNFTENYADIATLQGEMTTAQADVLRTQQQYYSRRPRILIGDSRYARTPYYIAGLRSSNWTSPTLFGNYATLADRIIAVPSWESLGSVIAKVGLQQVLSFSFSGVVGLYQDTGAGYPGTKVKDFGTITFGVNVSDDIHSLTSSYEIVQEDLYWYAVAFSAATTARIHGLIQVFGEFDLVNQPTAGLNPGFTNGRNDIMGMLATRTYDGTLPTTFPAGASIVQYATATTAIPAIYKAYSA